MTPSQPDTSAAFFDRLYQAQADPWDFAGNAYERHRYDRIIAALEGRHYGQAFEPGCSVGVLTELLSPLCGAVEAIDFSPTAIAEARRRCAHLGNVTLLAASLPDWLDSVVSPLPDLIVFSEIGYYFTVEELEHLAGRLVDRLATGGTLLAVHWLGHSPDHRLSGDDVYAILAGKARLQLSHSERHCSSSDPQQGFRLDRWSRI